MHHEYFFEVVNVLSCSPFMFENTENKQLDWRIRHSHLASTLFHSLVPRRRPRRIRPQITRLSQLENSVMGTWPIYKNSIIPDWFEKWRDLNSDTGVNCVVPHNYDVCPLLMMHKTYSINYGHLADLQRTLSTTDHNKKTLSFDKISPRDFYLFPFFSICTCAPVGPFSRPVVAGPAGAVCPRWRVARVTPGGSWIHVSGPLHRRTNDRGHSFAILVASKISLRLFWWPPTEHQCVLVYRCVFTHVCCWLFSVGNKVTTTTIK